MPERLLAKSWDGDGHPPPDVTLPGHSAAVLRAAERLLALRGASALHAAGLPQSLSARLDRVVRLGAILHDLGKASDQFQAMLHRTGAGQLVRHEAVSAWLAWQEPLRAWLAQAVGGDGELAVTIAAAAGHHRKFRDRAVALDRGLSTRLRVHSGHADVAAVLRLVSHRFGLMPQPVLQDTEIRVGMTGVQGLFADLERSLVDHIHADPQVVPLLAIAKALILDADVAGSALPKAGEDEAWIERQFGQRASRERVEQVVAARLGQHTLRPFQAQVAASAAPITLIEAGCGSGKTVAAYAWFARQHAGRQLWVTYPTTGTALEGFRDYLRGIDGLASDLESGRRDLDLQLCGLREQPGDDDAELRDADRIASLRAWGRDVIACTVDTVLGLVQNQRKGLYAFASLCDSAVVFDEIHAYDHRLFGCLLRFLRDLPGIPVLLMTASLPTSRREALERLCGERHNQPLAVIRGPAELEGLPRYRLATSEPSQAWSAVETTMAAGGKVLWVANTVDRCLAAAERGGPTALIYHSRFRYLDRVERHRAVIAAFAQPGPCLAVTTQVAEMSLDLSADLLITDLAPVSALIQRLGRLNRRSTPENPQPVRQALVLPVDNHLPYAQDHLDEATAWLAALTSGERSQRDLIAAWHPLTEPVDDIAGAWFDGGLDTEPREVREASPGLTVVRAEDAAAVRADPTQATALALPMGPPHGADAKAWPTWPRAGYLPIAPAGRIDYDPLRGARWVR